MPARATKTKAYTYDALGRLVAVASDESSSEERETSITYDAAGNRTVYASTGDGNPGGDGESPSAYTMRYTYNGRFFVQIISK